MDIHSPVNVVECDIISKLEITFGGSLHIQDDQKLEHVSDDDEDGSSNCHVGEGHICGGFEQEEATLKAKSLKESSTFPYSDAVLPSSSSDDDQADGALTESLSKQFPDSVSQLVSSNCVHK